MEPFHKTFCEKGSVSTNQGLTYSWLFKVGGPWELLWSCGESKARYWLVRDCSVTLRQDRFRAQCPSTIPWKGLRGKFWGSVKLLFELSMRIRQFRLAWQWYNHTWWLGLERTAIHSLTCSFIQPIDSSSDRFCTRCWENSAGQNQHGFCLSGDWTLWG